MTYSMNVLTNPVWARDLSPDFVMDGELTNQDAVDAAISNILDVYRKERLFSFIGSTVPEYVGAIVSNPSVGYNLIREIESVLSRYEPRIDPSNTVVDVKYFQSIKALVVNISYKTYEGIEGKYITREEL